MRQFIDVTGKTEDEAIANALAQLGMDRDDVSVEILERAKSGFLGLGSCPAKVRVSYGEEEEIGPPAVSKEEKPVEKKAEKPAEKKQEKRKSEKKAEKPAVKENVPQKEESAAASTFGEEVDDEKARAIKAFLSGLFAQKNRGQGERKAGD